MRLGKGRDAGKRNDSVQGTPPTTNAHVGKDRDTVAKAALAPRARSGKPPHQDGGGALQALILGILVSSLLIWIIGMIAYHALKNFFEPAC